MHLTFKTVDDILTEEQINGRIRALEEEKRLLEEELARIQVRKMELGG